MARDKQELVARNGNKPKPRKEAAKASWEVEFVNCELTTEDKAKLRALAFTPLDFQDVIVRLVEAGFKLSLSWDDRNSCVVASMTGKDTALAENRGKCMTARGSDAVMAFMSLSYKWFTIMGGEVFGDSLSDPNDDKLG